MMTITKPDPPDIENANAAEGVGTDLIPALHTDVDAVRRVQVHVGEQCSSSSSWSLRIRRRNPCTIRRTAISLLLLSTFAASIVYFEIYAGHSSLLVVAGFGRVFGPSRSEKGQNEKHVDEPSTVQMELGTREDILSSIILRRHEDERRFQREEENLRRERLGKMRHARMEAQEEKRILIEEERKVTKEKMLKVLQRQDEDKLRRDEERVLKKERLAIDRKERIDAHQEKIRMAQDQQTSEHQAMTLQETETEVTEDEHKTYVRRKAMLYTFAY